MSALFLMNYKNKIIVLITKIKYALHKPNAKAKHDYSCPLKYSLMAAAALLPAPIAKITVAAPVTASPPA